LCDVTAVWGTTYAYGSGAFQVVGWAEKIGWIADYLENTIKPQLDTIETNTTDAYSYLTSTIKPQLDSMSVGITKTLDNAVLIYDYLTGTIKPQLNQMQENVNYAKAQADAIKTVVNIIEGYQVPILENVLAVYINTATLITNTQNIIDNCNVVYNYLVNTITTKLDWVMDYLENTIKPELDSILSNVQSNYTYLSGTIKPQLDTMSANIGKTLDNAVAVYTYLTGTIKPTIDDTYSQTVTNYDYLTGTIKPQLDNIQENLEVSIPAHIEENILATYNYLVGTIKPELDNVYENVNATYDYLVNVIKAELDKVLKMAVDRYYKVNSTELQEFHVMLSAFSF
ncbi:unnamed protein product, partial [marine sediment metagenome]